MQHKIAVDPNILVTDVCIMVPGIVDASKIDHVATREGYVGVEVAWLQESKNREWPKRARLRMQNAQQRDDIIAAKGLCFGFVAMYALAWNIWRRLERCYNC